MLSCFMMKKDNFKVKIVKLALGRFNPFPPSVGLHIENNHFFVDDSIYDQKNSQKIKIKN